ncbi:unnamed protein product [Nesidiocoris tenuis]|uniref:Uncharacterized protein n=1 Tax=Nesidiocoris tenuis TaxID=355587 RepID=A0A6H5G504_9HEMI|nr:unnamed protein product [Nesidiocoris tenuis]
METNDGGTVLLNRIRIFRSNKAIVKFRLLGNFSPLTLADGRKTETKDSGAEVSDKEKKSLFPADSGSVTRAAGRRNPSGGGRDWTIRQIAQGALHIRRDGPAIKAKV